MKRQSPSMRDKILAASTREELDALVEEANTYTGASAKTARRIQRAIIKRIAEIKVELRKAA